MNKKILIVEDEFIVADDLQLTLERAGFHVEGIAASVPEAREMIKKKKPGLVLLDIHLKGKLSGIELAKELKEENIAFIYLSANSNKQILEAAKATDPYGFLVKPFREKDLLIALEIAFYHHEHSLETKWRGEMQLQKELSNIQNANDSWSEKLLKTARALQQYLPFDCLAVKFRTLENKQFNSFSFLRISFDEYQTIGIHELSVISGRADEEIQRLLTDTPVEKSAGWYNGDDFKRLFPAHPIKALYAQTFGFSSNLILPLLTSDGYIFSLSFFRRAPEGYSAEQLNWVLRLQHPLTEIINSISIDEKKDAFSKDYRFDQPPKKKISEANSRFEGIIGNSPALLNVMDLIGQVAPLDTSILILGESGTGKEKIANCIHMLSPRKTKPIVKINCAAIPASLIESELFGHEKGSFTGATEKRIGKFELADNGTIFLDEIGEVSADLQVKLLRVLQEKEIERIGGRQPIKVNVRVIAATNRNLENEMAQGRFRLDLYYRLNVFPVTLPPLRERKEDIQELAIFFAEQFSKKFNKPFHGISAEMLSDMEMYTWPGNIRELENIMEQSVILNDGKSKLTLRQPLSVKMNLKETHAETGTSSTIKTIDDIKRLQRQTEIEHISSVLAKTHGRIRGKDGAAELLNEKPTTLESRMAKLGIKKEDFL